MEDVVAGVNMETEMGLDKLELELEEDESEIEEEVVAELVVMLELEVVITGAAASRLEYR